MLCHQFDAVAYFGTLTSPLYTHCNFTSLLKYILLSDFIFLLCAEFLLIRFDSLKWKRHKSIINALALHPFCINPSSCTSILYDSPTLQLCWQGKQEYIKPTQSVTCRYILLSVCLRLSQFCLAQVMACLMAPSHYLNQCWLIINEFCGICKRAISQEVLNDINSQNEI